MCCEFTQGACFLRAFSWSGHKLILAGRGFFYRAYAFSIFQRSTALTELKSLGLPQSAVSWSYSPDPYPRCYRMLTTDTQSPALQGHASHSTISGVGRKHTTQCNFTLLSITGVIHAFLGNRKRHGCNNVCLTKQGNIQQFKKYSTNTFWKVLLPMKFNLKHLYNKMYSNEMLCKLEKQEIHYSYVTSMMVCLALIKDE